MTTLPLVVTQGDACGIGPEIICRAWAAGALANAVVVGDVAVMQRAAQQLGLPAHTAVAHGPAPQSAWPEQRLPVWPLHESERFASLAALPQGQVHALAGAAAAAAIAQAVAAVQAGHASAIVTAPIHKQALALAGVPHPGHTEMLQALAAPPGGPLPPVRMMLANAELRVVLVTVHMALARAIAQLSTPLISETIALAHAALRRMGIAAPRLAVAGLNPHAGEGGLFGTEEADLIAPAIAQARAAGIDASGPHPPDTVFMRARRGAFDAVVVMTHDHGLIPVKYLGVEEGVNVTLGLPFVRTSPDHGTAFDIAGRGVADASSLVAAMKMARRLTGEPDGPAA